MLKKQRKFWMTDEDYKLLQKKVIEQGYEGKGALTHFLERVARDTILFIKGEGKFKITML